MHFCKIYINKRNIPVEYHSKLYFTSNYKKFCDEIFPNHEKEITPDARLVIPFFDEYNRIIGISGRALVVSDDAKLSDVAKSVVENYTIYHECYLKNEAWKQWYTIHKNSFEAMR